MLGSSFSLSSSASQSSPVVTQTSNIITVSHSTSGSAHTPASGYIYNSGGGESNFTTISAAITGDEIIPTLTGTWNTRTHPATINQLIIRTNIVQADVDAAGADKHIKFILNQGYVNAPGNFAQGQRHNVTAGKLTLQLGPMAANSNASLGDFDVNVPGTATTYFGFMFPQTQANEFSTNCALNTAAGSAELAVGTNYLYQDTMLNEDIAGPGYWVYGFSIDSAYPNKDYKFQILALLNVG